MNLGGRSTCTVNNAPAVGVQRNMEFIKLSRVEVKGEKIVNSLQDPMICLAAFGSRVMCPQLVCPQRPLNIRAEGILRSMLHFKGPCSEILGT